MRRKGICMVCGCTELDACPDGCGWANLKKTLCTSCEPLSGLERETKKQIAMQDLAIKLEILLEDFADNRAELELRLAVLQPEVKHGRGFNKRPRSRRQSPVRKAVRAHG